MQRQKRINLVIDDKLIQEAMHLSGLTTRKAVVEAALILLIQINQIRKQGEIRKLRGKISWDTPRPI